MNTTSHWSRTSTIPRFRKLDQNYKVDVVVIGAGITGVTAAYLVKKAGHSVALMERGRCGGFDTSNTTAHLTCVTDTRLHELVAKFSKKTAKAVWDSGNAAIDQIYNNIRAEHIDCNFSWVPGYLHVAAGVNPEKERPTLEKDAELARSLGFPAQFIDSVPLVNRCGVKFSHQAKFHPLKYVAALLRTIPGKRSYVFEETEVEEIVDKPLAVRAGENIIHCSYLILATHTPLMGTSSPAWATLFQSKLFLYTSYAVGARVPANTALEASYWDTATPYNYLRIDQQRGSQYAILGGEDHKTGQEETTGPYERLEKRLKNLIPGAKVDSRWSGQVIETPDGLPFIGETGPKQFAATGFGGNGMTFGTLGAMMALEALEGRTSPWQKLYDVNRKKLSGALQFLRENKDYPYYLLRDWMASGEGKSLRGLHRNEGKILQLKGKKVAAYRDPHGKVSVCSPVCTHLGCIVGWNNAEKTWDCPCHGSRFAATGEVLSGPAEEPLEKIQPGEK